MGLEDKTAKKVFDYINKNIKQGFININTRKDLAKELDLASSTVSKKLKLLENEGYITIDNKGSKGIDIIIKEEVNIRGFLEEPENIIESENDYAVSLRERIYHKVENKRTAKEQVIHDTIKDLKRKNINEMNFRVKGKPFPTKDIFDLSEDPEGYFKTYIISKIYDKLCSIHLQVRSRKYREKIDKAIEDNESQLYINDLRDKKEYYDKQSNNYKRNQTLVGEFFDSNIFKQFYELYKLTLTLKDFDVLRYMINVFSTVSFSFEHGYAKKPIPYPIQFTQEKMIENYYKYRNAIKKGMNKDNRQLSNYTQRMNSEPEYTDDIVLEQLKVLLVKDYKRLPYDMDTAFAIAIDYDDYKFGITQQKQQKLLSFYSQFYKEIENINEEDKKLLDKYVKELIINDYAPKTITNTYRLSMFPLQRAYILDTILTEKHKVLSLKHLKDLGLLYSGTKLFTSDKGLDSPETNIALGASYIQAYKNIVDYQTIRMFGYYTEVDVNIKEVKRILEENNLKGLLPLTKHGMLEI